MECLLEGCQVKAATRMGMRIHFLHHHVQDTVIIVEEGNLLHPRCPLCDMLVLWAALNIRYPYTTQCTNGEKRQWHRLVQRIPWLSRRGP